MRKRKTVCRLSPADAVSLARFELAMSRSSPWCDNLVSVVPVVPYPLDDQTYCTKGKYRCPQRVSSHSPIKMQKLGIYFLSGVPFGNTRDSKNCAFRSAGALLEAISRYLADDAGGGEALHSRVPHCAEALALSSR
jgi:hypothetical protein